MLVARYETLSPTSKVFVHRALSPRTLFAETKYGELVHIDHTETGTQNLTCPDCHRRIFARHYRDGSRIDHFYHARDSDDGSSSIGECTSSGETALHLLAKEIILASKSLSIPEVVVCHRGETRRVQSAMTTTLLSAEIEKSLGSIRPDAMVRHQAGPAEGENMAIEVYVTHAVDDQKIEAFRGMDLDVLEINLRQIDRSINLQELTELVLHTASRQWLINRSAEREREDIEADWQLAEKLRKDTRAAALAQEQAKKDATEKLAREREARVEEIISAWQRAAPDASREDLQESETLKRDLLALGLDTIIPKPKAFDPAFSVDHRIWKTRIIREFAGNRQKIFTIYDVLELVSESGYAKPELAANISDIIKECWDKNSEIRSVFSSLVEFISNLVDEGALQEVVDGKIKRYKSFDIIGKEMSLACRKDSGLISLAKYLGERGYHIAVGEAVLRTPGDLVPFLAHVRGIQKRDTLLTSIEQIGEALQLYHGKIPWWLPKSCSGFDLIDKKDASRRPSHDVISDIFSDMQELEKDDIRTTTRSTIEAKFSEHPCAAELVIALLGRQLDGADAMDAFQKALEKEMEPNEDVEKWRLAAKKFGNKISACLQFFAVSEAPYCRHIQHDAVRGLLEDCPREPLETWQFDKHLHAIASELQQKEAPARRKLKLLNDRLKNYGRKDFLTRSMAMRISIDDLPFGCKALEDEILKLRKTILDEGP